MKVFHHPDNPITYSAPLIIRKAIHGMSNGIFPKNYNQAFNQLSQNKMFWADRVQLIIIDKTIFEHHKNILSKEFDTSAPITYHDLIKSKTSYAVAFNHAVLRDQFNEGLKKIRANGSYQKIIDAYK